MQLSDAPFNYSGSYPHIAQRNYLTANFYNTIISAAPPTAYDPLQFLDLSAYHDPRFPTMEPLSREELERFQKLSNEYEPDIQVRNPSRQISLGSY